MNWQRIDMNHTVTGGPSHYEGCGLFASGAGSFAKPTAPDAGYRAKRTVDSPTNIVDTGRSSISISY